MGDAPKADPGSTPRIGKRGEAKREKSIFRVDGDDWFVEVTPIAGGRYGTRFEVRAEFPGPVLGEFEHARTTPVRRIAEHYIADHDLAQNVAIRAADLLGKGERDLFLPRLEREQSG